MAADALLERDSNPSEETVRRSLSNNLCMCTGYEGPVKAVLEAAKSMREKKNE